MSVLARFFELALVFTFMLFCINGILFYFGDTMAVDSSAPISDLTGDQNVFIESDENNSYILQAATLGTAPTNVEYVADAILRLSIGFELKLVSILSVYELDALTGIAYFISSILVVIRVIGIMYLVLALIGTPLGGSVP